MHNVIMEEKVLKLNKSNWVPTKLGELATEISKRVDNPSESEYERFVGLGNFVSGDIKIKSWEVTDNLASSAKAFQSGDILFARRNAYLRRASMVDFDGCCSGDAFVLRENHEKIVPGFLAFLLNSDTLWDYANSNAAGTMSKRVKWRDLAEYEFLLPPKDQQAKLAELLWAMDEVIERENEVLGKLKIDKTVSLKNYFKEYTKEVQLKKIGEIITGSTPSTKNKDYWNGDIQFVTPADLETQIKVKKTVRCISEKGLQVTREIPPNSVMVVCIASVGKMGISTKRCATNQQINTIIPNVDINPKYLYNTLNLFIHRIISRAANSVVPILNKGDFSRIKMPLLDKIERDKFVKIADKFDDSINDFESKIQSSKALQKSLINQVF